MEFRPLTDGDLPLLHRWLNDPRVKRWWEGEDVSWLGVVRRYRSANPDPVEHWIGMDRGVDVGWIQCYSVTDFSDEEEAQAWFRLGVRRSAAGIDYLVGASSRRGRGLGPRMISAFVDEVVFGRHPHWDQVCASPFTANSASWRALSRAGFDPRGTFFSDGDPCRLMVRERR